MASKHDSEEWAYFKSKPKCSRSFPFHSNEHRMTNAFWCTICGKDMVQRLNKLKKPTVKKRKREKEFNRKGKQIQSRFGLFRID